MTPVVLKMLLYKISELMNQYCAFVNLNIEYNSICTYQHKKFLTLLNDRLQLQKNLFPQHSLHTSYVRKLNSTTEIQ